MALGLDRTQAAAWATEATGYEIGEANIRQWERKGLLRSQTPGNRRPATYRVDDLVRLKVLVELRRDGVPLQRIRAAVEWLTAHLPEVEERPGAWRLAVRDGGEVVRLEDPAAVLELTRAPGQLSLIEIDPLRAAKDARRAIRQARKVG